MKKVILLLLSHVFTVTVYSQVTMTGTTNGKVPYITGSNALAESDLFINPTTKFYGFGTTSPSFKYDFNTVFGDKLRFATLYFTNALDVSTGYTRGSLGSNLYYNSTTYTWVNPSPGNNDYAAMMYLNGGAIGFFTDAGTGNTARTFTQGQLDPSLRLKIKGNGKIGFGGIDPSTVFEIKPLADEDGMKLRRFSAAGKAQVLLANESGVEQWRFGMTTANSFDLAFFDGTKNVILMKKGGTLLFDPTGNIGIGTSSPQQKLSVNGSIQAKEVIVTTDPLAWPDFVFSPDYELMPIDQLSNYISKNGHLPEIPSKDDIAKNGAAVGEIQTKLLQKIEELSLYIIEQDKRIKKLENDQNSK